MSFHTLELQDQAIHPSKSKVHYQELSKISLPHLESFNSLFQFDSDGGLLDLAISNIPKMIVFDGIKGEAINDQNKLTSIFFVYYSVVIKSNGF
jgi:hypothetical protein